MNVGVRIGSDVGVASRIDAKGAVCEMHAAYAPGTPLRAEFDAPLGVVVDARAVSSRRRSEGGFDVTLRFVNLSRSQRDAIAALTSGAPPTA